MKKDIKFPNAIQAGTGFRGYQRAASSFWLNEDFDTDRSEEHTSESSHGLLSRMPSSA